MAEALELFNTYKVASIRASSHRSGDLFTWRFLDSKGTTFRHKTWLALSERGLIPSSWTPDYLVDNITMTGECSSTIREVKDSLYLTESCCKKASDLTRYEEITHYLLVSTDMALKHRDIDYDLFTVIKVSRIISEVITPFYVEAKRAKEIDSKEYTHLVNFSRLAFDSAELMETHFEAGSSFEHYSYLLEYLLRELKALIPSKFTNAVKEYNTFMDSQLEESRPF